MNMMPARLQLCCHQAEASPQEMASQEIPGDGRCHTALFISIFSNPHQSAVHSEFPYMSVELVNKYMTIYFKSNLQTFEENRDIE